MEEIVNGPESYVPKFNIDNGIYEDIIPLNSKLYAEKYPDGLQCCNGKTFLERNSFKNHTKTNTHTKWLCEMVNEENNPIKKNIEHEKTIKSQQIIIQHQSNEIFRMNLKINEINKENKENNEGKIENNQKGIFYIIKDRESVRMQESVFKIGITERKFHKRFNEYGKDARVYLLYHIENPVSIENKIKERFSKEFKLVRGTEYFEGHLYKMVEIATEILCK